MLHMLVIDAETKSFFLDALDGVSLSAPDLQVSFVGAYDSEENQYYSYWEKDMKKLEEQLSSTDAVIGYNIWAFDYGVLSPYLQLDLWSLPTIDLMLALKKAIGFRPKLDDIARLNINTGKIAKGVDAVTYWQNGQYDKLEEYCLEDVRLTYEVWKKGDQGGLKYYDTNGFPKETAVNWRDGFMQRVPEDLQGRLV